MKLATAIKRLEQQFGLVGIQHEVQTWEQYQPVQFWLFTDKYFVKVLTLQQYSGTKGYLQFDEFSKEQVDYLATQQPFIRLEISLKDNHDAECVRFRVRNAQGFQNVLDKLDNDPKYSNALKTA
jgi:hypothetical protein